MLQDDSLQSCMSQSERWWGQCIAWVRDPLLAKGGMRQRIWELVTWMVRRLKDDETCWKYVKGSMLPSLISYNWNHTAWPKVFLEPHACRRVTPQFAPIFCQFPIWRGTTWDSMKWFGTGLVAAVPMFVLMLAAVTPTKARWAPRLGPRG